MDDGMLLNRRQFLRTTGQAATTLAAASSFAPAFLSAPASGKTIGVGCIGLGTRGGLLSQLRDDREVRDTWAATYQFEKLGRTVTFTGSMNTSTRQPVEICGRDGTLRFDDIAHNATTFEVLPESHNKRPNLPKGYEQGKTPAQPNHMVDWVNCIQNRGTPKCSADEAFIETATFLMSLKSQQEQRLVRWDAAKEEIV